MTFVGAETQEVQHGWSNYLSKRYSNFLPCQSLKCSTRDMMHGMQSRHFVAKLPAPTVLEGHTHVFDCAWSGTSYLWIKGCRMALASHKPEACRCVGVLCTEHIVHTLTFIRTGAFSNKALDLQSAAFLRSSYSSPASSLKLDQREFLTPWLVIVDRFSFSWWEGLLRTWVEQKKKKSSYVLTFQ